MILKKRRRSVKYTLKVFDKRGHIQLRLSHWFKAFGRPRI